MVLYIAYILNMLKLHKFYIKNNHNSHWLFFYKYLYVCPENRFDIFATLISAPV